MDTKPVLEKLLRSFLDNGMEEADLIEKEKSGLGTDMLAVWLKGFGSISNEAVGEFYFIGDKPCIFNARISVLDEIEDDKLPTLSAEIADINSRIPLGGFSYDPVENVIFYSLRVPVRESFSEKEITEEADSAAALSLSVAGSYVSVLLKVYGGSV